MSHLYFLLGHVFHARNETAENSFKYPIFNVYFSLDELENLKSIFRTKFLSVLGLNPRDYLLNDSDDLKSRIESFTKDKFGFKVKEDYDQVFLQTIPKMFGYVFNPVSFWYFFKNTNLNAVLCEVNNTFGEKHFYWLTSKSLNLNDQWLEAEKEFHVSPFFPINGSYQFKFKFTNDKVESHINLISATGGKKRLITWVKGELQPVDQVSVWSLILNYGWMTPLVVLRIHYQAVKLFTKRVKFFKKPELLKNRVTAGKVAKIEKYKS